MMWPSTIQLSHDYFVSLQEHAVPLNEADLAALAHSAMALDLYAWLAQRLHRVTPMRPAAPRRSRRRRIRNRNLDTRTGADFLSPHL
jgi:Plasmid encoded RepA protein